MKKFALAATLLLAATAFASLWTTEGEFDADSSNASWPSGMAYDSSGNLYVSFLTFFDALEFPLARIRMKAPGATDWQVLDSSVESDEYVFTDPFGLTVSDRDEVLTTGIARKDGKYHWIVRRKLPDSPSFETLKIAQANPGLTSYGWDIKAKGDLIISAGAANDTQGRNCAILRSADHGMTFQFHFPVREVRSCRYLSVAIQGTRVVAVGEATIAGGGRAGIVSISDDEGATWRTAEPWQLKAPNDTTFSALALASDGGLWIGGQGEDVPGAAKGLVLRLPSDADKTELSSIYSGDPNAKTTMFRGLLESEGTLYAGFITEASTRTVLIRSTRDSGRSWQDVDYFHGSLDQGAAGGILAVDPSDGALTVGNYSYRPGNAAYFSTIRKQVK